MPQNDSLATTLDMTTKLFYYMFDKDMQILSQKKRKGLRMSKKKYSELKMKGSDRKQTKVVDHYRKVDAKYAKQEGINLESVKKGILSDLNKMENLGEQTFVEDGKFYVCLSKKSKKHYLKEGKKFDDQKAVNRVNRFNDGNFDCLYSSKDERFAITDKSNSIMVYTDMTMEQAKERFPYNIHANSGKSRFV